LIAALENDTSDAWRELDEAKENPSASGTATPRAKSSNTMYLILWFAVLK
jgi:hypothetical protein